MSSLFLAKSAATAVSSAAAVYIPVGKVATDRMTQAVPKKCKLSKVEVQLTAIAGGMANVLLVVCRKSNGDQPFTPTSTKVIVAGVTAATGSVAEHYADEVYVWDDGDDGLYVGILPDAGTATATVRVTGGVE